MKKFFEILKLVFAMMKKKKIPKINIEYLGSLPSKLRTRPIYNGIIHSMSYVNRDQELRYDIHKCIELFKELRVSAHAFIAREGTIYELVADDRVAFHAGKSQWNGRKHLNNYTFGVELIGCYEGKYLSEGFTEEQYESLVYYVSEKNRLYDLSVMDWVGHSEISPGRKKDPGEMFDWSKFRKMMAL